MNSTPRTPSVAPDPESECARCGSPIRFDPKDPDNCAMRVCNDCAIDLDEEINQ